MKKVNKTGETSIGFIVLAFIGIIVALALFTPIADTTGSMRNLQTETLANYTTAVAANDSITLEGREVVGTVVVVDATNTSDVWTANFSSVTTNTAGSLANLLKTSDAAVTAGQNGSLVSVTYTYKPYGYNDGSGARSIIGIVLIFAAITIMAFAYGPVRDALSDIGIGN